MKEAVIRLFGLKKKKKKKRNSLQLRHMKRDYRGDFHITIGLKDELLPAIHDD